MNIPKKITKELIFSISIRGIILSLLLAAITDSINFPWVFFIKMITTLIGLAGVLFMIMILGIIALMPSWVFDTL